MCIKGYEQKNDCDARMRLHDHGRSGAADSRARVRACVAALCVSRFPHPRLLPLIFCCATDCVAVYPGRNRSRIRSSAALCTGLLSTSSAPAERKFCVSSSSALPVTAQMGIVQPRERMARVAAMPSSTAARREGGDKKQQHNTTNKGQNQADRKQVTIGRLIAHRTATAHKWHGIG